MNQIVELKEAKAKQDEVNNNIFHFLRSKSYDNTLNYKVSSSSS